MHVSEVDLAPVRRLLEDAGCVASPEEAVELAEAAADPGELRRLLARRCDGEPLAWVTGRTRFCGIEVHVAPGVYVPRWQSEPLAKAAAALVPENGIAVDVCTGSGALAMVLQAAHPDARVLGTDIDPAAVACAEANGVAAFQGDLDAGVPRRLLGRVDVMTAVVPYVPSRALGLLPRDVRRFEPRRALDGGETGLDVLRAVVARSCRWLRPGGWLLVEVGMDQVAETRGVLLAGGFRQVSELADQDGDPRGVIGSFTPTAWSPRDSGAVPAGAPRLRSQTPLQEQP